jgi:anti-sigma factor RsiW
MNHSEALEQLAAERYLLDELTPDAREAFEEHMFDCQECALDLRAGAVFVDEAKAQLPEIATSSVAPAKPVSASSKPSLWHSWWRPAFVAPAFATVLLALIFQNFVTIPALRTAATKPHLVPLAPLHPATRGGTHPTFTADRAHGVALPVDLPVEPGMTPAASYSFDLRDPQGKVAWTASIPAAAQDSTDDQSFSIVIPGGMLRDGPYSLTVTSVSPNGDRTPRQQYDFDIVVTN